MEHELLPLGRHSFANRPHHVYAVVISLYQLLNLLCHLHCHLVGFLFTISHTCKHMITSMLHLSLKYCYNYYSNFALWLNTLAAHNLP